MTDLIYDGTLLALYTDDEKNSDYSFYASSCPETLAKSEIDDWGTSFDKHSNVNPNTILRTP